MKGGYKLDKFNIITMETIFDIILIIVLLSLSTLPVILCVSLIMMRRMYNDWKKYMDKL